MKCTSQDGASIFLSKLKNKKQTKMNAINPREVKNGCLIHYYYYY